MKILCMNPDLKYKVALTMVKGVGPLIAKKLISSFGNAEMIFRSSRKSLEAVPGVGGILAEQIKKPGLLERAERELSFMDKIGGDVVCFEDPDYPNRLRDCEDLPIVLYRKGSMKVNANRVLGVVGTRKMTSYGKKMVEEILEGLACRFPDLLVISGLAYGVDGCAHRKAVELGLPSIGVVGHGLDMLYPAEHRTLANRLMQNGGLLSEFHSKSIIDRKNFVSRNRIIAGMSDVVLVVESGMKGGALLTAEFANSYNRDVCAVPGRVGDIYSMGCNQLIKSNRAVMVESSDDIIELMNWDAEQESKGKVPVAISTLLNLTEKERLVVSALEIEDKMQVNHMSRKLQISMGELSSLLFEMEMRDLVMSLPGGVYTLK